MEGASATTGDSASEYIDSTKTSIECLREAKPAEDISIKSKASDKCPSSRSSQLKMPSESGPLEQPLSSAKIETVFEKISINSDQTEPAADDIPTKDTNATELKEAKSGAKDATKAKLEVPSLNFEVKSRSSEPKGDVLSKTETKISAVSLYSVKGSPSGRISRRRESSNVFPVGCMGCKDDESPRRFLDAHEASNDFVGHVDNIPKKRPSSGKQDASRNPVTGAGIEPTTGRRQCIKRKDGNPLLGTGYEAEPPSSTASRIPPGGYSKGLW